MVAGESPSAGGVRGVRSRVLSDRILILAPHMDDETLACGGVMILHARKAEIHILFATDGAASPIPLLPWLGRTDDDLPRLRQREARAATARLGVPPENLQFLDLPDGGLAARRAELAGTLAQAIADVQPGIVFAPFRYDVHPDHVALNRAAREVLRSRPLAPTLLEYFVYHRLRFVPGGDVRRVLSTSALLTVDTPPVAAEKRAALDCYESQTTICYPWQERPILTAEGLRQYCSEPELFLLTDPAARLSEGFAAHRGRVRLASLAMRYGKRPKDQAVAFLRWILGR